MANTIVIYYSLEGNVDFVAKKIAENLGADIFRIETLKEYPKKGLLKFFHGGKDVVSGVKPELIHTFFDKVNLSGKKCYAFASSGGGNSKKCLEIMSAEITKKGGTVAACAEFTNPLKKLEVALKTIAEFTGKL